jgi:hypothetical protein
VTSSRSTVNAIVPVKNREHQYLANTTRNIR